MNFDLDIKTNLEIDMRSPDCAYIKMGDLVVYLDNSTGEQIVETWTETECENV
jgi:hypothetical protein